MMAPFRIESGVRQEYACLRSTELRDPLDEELIVKKFRSREAKLALLRDIGNPPLKKGLINMLPGIIFIFIGMALLLFVGFYGADTSLRSLITPIFVLVIGLINFSSAYVDDINKRMKKLTDFLAEEIEAKKLDD